MEDEKGIDACPAFKEGGCPFSSVSMKSAEMKCPAFKDGCPFKEVRTATELGQALKQVPITHGQEGTTAQVALAQMLGATHKESSAFEKKCPVFAAECPFKKIEPLKSSAEREWRGWWTAPDSDHEEDEVAPKSSTSYGSKSSKDTLSVALKNGTEKVHAEAENVLFVKALLQREAPVAAYLALLVRLLRVYEALEKSMESAESDGHNFFLKQLRRTPSLRADIQFYYSKYPDLKKIQLEDSPATDAYVARIQHLEKNKRYDLLTAHTYTRYLGDLSGGQVLKRAVKRGLLHRTADNNADDGLSFYTFSEIGGPRELKRFKDQYRIALDTDSNGQRFDPIVQEAVTSFRHNTALLAECDAFLQSKTPTPQISPNKKTTGGCPFLQGIDISKLPKDMQSYHHSSTDKPTASTLQHHTSKCPFAHFTLRDCLLVAALTACFLALPFALPSSSSTSPSPLSTRLGM